MARKPRIHVSGGIYHVMLRGNGGQDIFFTDADRYRFYLLLQEMTSRFQCRIHAFCLMTNHGHLAIQVGDIPLAKIMQNLCFRYTRWIHSRKGTSGHLFQGRYKAVLVQQESYLLELVRYIHLNPVCAKMVDSLDHYLWSGHRAYLGQEMLPWLTTDWVLGQFGTRATVARRKYLQFVLDGIGRKSDSQLQRGHPDDSRVLGEDSFLEHVLHRSSAENPAPSLEEIEQGVAESFSLSVAQLSAPGRRQIPALARALVAMIATRRGTCTLTEVARRYGRDVATLSLGIRKLEEKITWDKKGADLCRVVLGRFEGGKGHVGRGGIYS